MSEERKAELEAKGVVFTTVAEWLGLDEVDVKVVEARVRVGREVRRLREATGTSQRALAGRMGVSQPRIPAIESGSGGATLDAAVSAFFAMGGGLEELGAVIAGR